VHLGYAVLVADEQEAAVGRNPHWFRRHCPASGSLPCGGVVIAMDEGQEVASVNRLLLVVGRQQCLLREGARDPRPVGGSAAAAAVRETDPRC